MPASLSRSTFASLTRICSDVISCLPGGFQRGLGGAPSPPVYVARPANATGIRSRPPQHNDDPDVL